MKFTKKEILFLETTEAARIATCHDNIPHVKPVSFVFHSDSIFIATDYDTRTFENIKKNSKAAFVVDIYKSGDHKAVCIQGKTDILENGGEYEIIYQIFHKRFKWVRDDPWKPKEAPFLKLVPKSKVSWGIN